jgi:transposase
VKIIEILRLSEEGYSQRQIATSVKCAKSTVGEVQRRCKEKGLQYTQAMGMTNDKIKELLYPTGTMRISPEHEPDWEEIEAILNGKTRRNRQYLWEEYRVGHPDGLSYSQYCKRYQKWRLQTG